MTETFILRKLRERVKRRGGYVVGQFPVQPLYGP
jgi:hypothetical protein